MRLVPFTIALAASFLPDKIIKMNFVTSLIVSTIVYYVVYVAVKRAIDI